MLYSQHLSLLHLMIAALYQLAASMNAFTSFLNSSASGGNDQSIRPPFPRVGRGQLFADIHVLDYLAEEATLSRADSRAVCHILRRIRSLRDIEET